MSPSSCSSPSVDWRLAVDIARAWRVQAVVARAIIDTWTAPARQSKTPPRMRCRVRLTEPTAAPWTCSLEERRPTSRPPAVARRGAIVRAPSGPWPTRPGAFGAGPGDRGDARASRRARRPPATAPSWAGVASRRRRAPATSGEVLHRATVRTRWRRGCADAQHVVGSVWPPAGRQERPHAGVTERLHDAQLRRTAPSSGPNDRQQRLRRRRRGSAAMATRTSIAGIARRHWSAVRGRAGPPGRGERAGLG